MSETVVTTAKSASAEVAVELVILGVTQAGQTFRPSDWAERLCGVMCAFGGDHRMQYSPYVYPISASGLRCVVIDLRLEEVEPMAFRFLLSFAGDNELRTREGRVEDRTLLAQIARGEVAAALEVLGVPKAVAVPGR